MISTEVYKLWAPDESLWSNWVKPVLFIERGVAPFPPVDWRQANVAWAPGVDAATAIILDLEEAFPVWMGLALAARGYRPVPLYNGASGPSAIVEVGRIAGALHAAARELAGFSVAPDAPPIFLLDAKRSGGSALVSPGRFDNRWAVFPQDFPSANFMLARGIRAVVLGQASAQAPQPDLAHVLLRWQEAGIQILSCDVRGSMAPTPMRVSRPGHFRSLWYRALVLAGLRRNSAGGFGAVVPQPSQSGGYG
jgi:hypothetical protein